MVRLCVETCYNALFQRRPQEEHVLKCLGSRRGGSSRFRRDFLILFGAGRVRCPILEPVTNEIYLPDVDNGLGVALNIISMNNCFRVVVGCVADWQQETLQPF